MFIQEYYNIDDRLHLFRHQERHLGISDRVKRATNKGPVNVYIHKMDSSANNGDHNIELLYHVAVDGKPVSAITAAKDMSYIKDEEVRKELGFPFLIKAERKYLYS